MSAISNEEIQFSYVWAIDEFGRVFHWEGRIFRGIYSAAAEKVRELFSSGFLDELMDKGLFPRSWISDYSLEGFALVVEHERVPFITYPHEWSFDMLRAAALAVLEISEIAGRYGFGLKDCHPYNLLFNGAQPVYVDLGSFIRVSEAGFAPGAEFLSGFWWPLSIWAAGDSFLAQRITSSVYRTMPYSSWQLYNSPVTRRFGSRWALCLIRLWRRLLRRLVRMIWDEDQLKQTTSWFAGRLPVDYLVSNHQLLRRKVEGLSSPAPTTFWHNYHDEQFQGAAPSSTPRFDRVLEIVRSLGCESVVELAGNQGLVSLLLASKTSVRRVVCTDDDGEAINRLYGYCRSHPAVPAGKTVQPAVVNFMVPEMNFLTTPPAERFRSDLVIALAITHHLVLSQNFPLREILRTIAGYTRRFAMVEFMPLGLWNGKEAPPFPSWYDLRWFQQAFQELFELILVEQVAENRMLHLGRRRGT